MRSRFDWHGLPVPDVGRGCAAWAAIPPHPWPLLSSRSSGAGPGRDPPAKVQPHDPTFLLGKPGIPVELWMAVVQKNFDGLFIGKVEPL